MFALFGHVVVCTCALNDMNERQHRSTWLETQSREAFVFCSRPPTPPFDTEDGGVPTERCAIEIAQDRFSQTPPANSEAIPRVREKALQVFAQSLRFVLHGVSARCPIGGGSKGCRLLGRGKVSCSFWMRSRSAHLR